MHIPSRPNILLVEDDPQVQSCLARVLQRAGATVSTAETGPEGLRRLVEDAPEIVVLDMNLPGMEGMEVLRAGRAVRPDVRFVVLTGAATVDMAVEAMKLGAFDFLCKPVATDELLRVVGAAGEAELCTHRPEAGDLAPSLMGVPLGALARVKTEVERELIARAARERWNLDQVEQEYILEVLRQTNGHQIRAAEILGVDRRTLYRKLRRYRVRSPEPDQE